MKSSPIAFAAGLAAGALAVSTFVAMPLVVNGKETADGATTVGDKVFVSADALRAGGAQVSVAGGKVQVNFLPLGGRDQVDAVEGSLGEWIQNDGWRIRVEPVETSQNPFGKGPGFDMKVEMRNLAKKPMSPFASGMDKLQIIDADGNIVAFAQPKFREYFGDVAPGGGFTATVPFGDPANKLSELKAPEKLMIFFRKTGNVKLKDFRVFLKPTRG